MNTTHTYSKEHPPTITKKVGEKEVVVALTPTKFGKTSDFKGQDFWTLVPTAATQDTVRAFLGDDWINTQIERSFRRVAMDVFIDKNGVYETKDENGHINWPNVLKALAEYDSGGATLSDLNDQMSELVDTNYALMEDANYERNEDMTFVNPTEGPKIHQTIMENIGKQKKLKVRVAAIEEKYAKIAAKRQASKANTATAA